MTTDMQIDFGESSFSEGGQTEEEDERARREAEAMLALERRIAERAGADAGIIDPWQAEGYAPQERDPWQDRQRMSTATPQPLPEPVPELRNPWQGMPQMSVVDPSVQQPLPPLQSVQPEPVLASMPAAPEQSTPSPLAAPLTPEQQQPAPITPAEPPPMPVAGEASPDATTNPNAPTVTAGASAQAMREGGSGLAAPQVPGMPQQSQGAPAFAGGGATGLERAQVDPRIAAGEPAPNMFARQQEAAQGQDDRRDRIRKIMKALAAIGGMATIGSGGSVGGAVPGAIGAMMVGDSNAEERLLASDARSRELSDEDARRQQLLEQMQLRRQALQGTEANRAAQLDLRRQEQQSRAEDRALNTGYRGAAEQRNADRERADSGISRTARMQFREWLATSPQEIRDGVNQDALDGMSAHDLEKLQRELSGNYNSSNIGGGRGRGNVARSLGARAATTEGVGRVPETYVNMVRSRITEGEDPNVAAQGYWENMSDEDRRDYIEDPEADKWRTRFVGQYRQTRPGLMSDAEIGQATGIAAAEASFDVLIDRAEAAAAQIDALPAGEQALTRIAGAAGVPVHDAIAEFEDVRTAMISELNRMAGGGTLDQAEYARWSAALPSITSLRGLAPGAATRRMRASFERAKAQARAQMRARGFERVETSGAGQPGTGANGQPVQGDAPVTGGQAQAAPNMVTITFRRPDGSTRSRQIDARQREHYIRRAPEGWTVVQ